MTPAELRHRASFRDPSGFLFHRDGILYRQINVVYRENYGFLMQGLYARLVKAGLMVAHEEVDIPPAEPSMAFKVIQPEEVCCISYPYEWSFSQLKDAALTTLKIQRLALDAGMSLKDSSAYNIQFHNGKPVLIDTLSFEKYQEGQPWVAYRQFCQHFLAPLALMALKDVRLNQLLRIYIDGIPLDLASELLPGKTRLNLALATHIHLHAAAQKRYADKGVSGQKEQARVSKMAVLGLVDSLEGAVKGLEWKPAGTEWGEYYDHTNYSSQAFEFKRKTVEHFIEQVKPNLVWDLGGNTGEFSRSASGKGIQAVAFDIDPAAVETNYRIVKQKKETHMLPLLLDLTNPSPSLGWANQERQAFQARGKPDMLLGLALIHHLVISNNVPMAFLADFFASLGRWLVIEFVPKGDSQVQRLLTSREDIFPNYTREDFEQVFSERYTIREVVPVEGSQRHLYLMERKD